MSVEPNIQCDWSAWYNRQPGRDDPNLRVVGHCKLPSGSTQIHLEHGNEGGVDEPKLLVLQCTVDVPDYGTGDWVERDVGWQDDVGQEIERVRIQGDLQATIKVDIIT